MYMMSFIFRVRKKAFIEGRCQMCVVAHRACTAASALHSRTATPHSFHPAHHHIRRTEFTNTLSRVHRSLVVEQKRTQDLLAVQRS